MSRLNKVLQQNNVTEHKKKKAKQKKTVMPVYDMTGKTITPEKKRRENRIAVAVIVVTVLLSFLYLPGLFIEDNKEIVNTNAAVKIDSTAIRKSNTALRNNAEEDFDGDGLTNAEESTYGTDPWQIDTDNDGLTDYCEIKITKTAPDSVDDNLVDAQTKLDKANEKNVGSPYKIGNVILWAEDYSSKSFGSVVETSSGAYHFCYFNGYAQFPESAGKYAYRIKDGVRTALPYRKAENAWKITSGDIVEIYEKPLEKVIEFQFFKYPVYAPSNVVTDILAKILPDNGFITATSKMKMDIEPDTNKNVITDIKKPAYNSSDDYRFTINSNTLNDLLFVRESIAEDNSCIAMSLFNKDDGEYLGIIYGYTAEGDLLIADMDTLKPVGTLKISESARKMMNETGEIVSVSYFDFEGFGFSSQNGDRISFFAASSKINSMESHFEKEMKEDKPSRDTGKEIKEDKVVEDAGQESKEQKTDADSKIKDSEKLTEEKANTGLAGETELDKAE